ncbi:Spore photoproduct lyase [hydrothermal vent metagenome]|uniref:Spore photoproduct lyase n=1 Tax=hydrothermal vent metagenome TaxID=652676 RepID=A0A3B1DT34_9ZZZZ
MDLDRYNFTVSQKNILKNIMTDFKMWNENNIEKSIFLKYENCYQGKQLSKKIFEYIVSSHKNLKENENDYKIFKNLRHKANNFSYQTINKNGFGLGACPVASEGTRCCNLLTLDVVESCGFDCSYCSIQSFYAHNKIGFDKNLKTKLKNIKLDPKQIYHIGTGQSSDSLLWGNREGILDALFDFAFSNPNVILEFKTKSNNITYFIKNKNKIPKNIIVTWSLNTPTIISNEEHLTSSLEQRLSSARALSDIGVLIGFHFHPIIQYKDYLSEYKELYKKVQELFTFEEVILISFGTLTFTKPVINKLRQRAVNTKVLQMPFETINNKQSYCLKTKLEMFKVAYDSFKSWHHKVYFYLCMEDKSLWKQIFGYEYSSNNQFEDFMLNSYMDKINKKDLKT